VKIYYKVVSYDLCSILYRYLPREFIVQYKIGEWIYPKVKNTKLMVFDNLASASRFAPNYPIYTCVVKNPTNKAIFIDTKNIFSELNRMWFPTAERCIPLAEARFLIKFKSMWKKLRKKQQQHKKFFSPKGIPTDTVFVSAIKLLKKVY